MSMSEKQQEMIADIRAHRELNELVSAKISLGIATLLSDLLAKSITSNPDEPTVPQLNSPVSDDMTAICDLCAAHKDFQAGEAARIAATRVPEPQKFTLPPGTHFPAQKKKFN